MYCKNCGKIINDDSRFCSFCGEFLTSPQITTSSQQTESDHQDIKIASRFIGINISRQVVGISLIWFLIHLILLLINWKTNPNANERFWPFSKYSELDDYDFSEFILYTVVPFFLLIIFKILKNPKEKKLESLQSKYDQTYENDSAATLVGLWLFFSSICLYLLARSFFNGFDADSEQIIYIFISIICLIVRIGAIVWVASIAKKLNRDVSIWVFFALFFPAIALIVIGQKRKLKIP